MKNKVLFVEPMGAPSNIFAKFMSIPLLGPVYLATLAKKAGYNASIFNENIMKRRIQDCDLRDVDVLCLSCITATIERGKKIALQYREARKAQGLSTRVIVGGIHASMMPDDVEDYFDQIIRGEAEDIFLDVLNGKRTEKIVNGHAIENLDSIPVPDFSLVQGGKKVDVWPVMTSRGCPHHCNFCSVTKMFGKRYRVQSCERVFEELFRYNSGWVFFVDDNFTAIPLRTHKLLDGMIRYGFKRPWSAQVRTDLAKNPDLVAKMRKAGCSIVYVGLESINPVTLVNMQKNQTLEDIQNAIHTFQKHGIEVHGMFMFGNDMDTKDIFKSTAQFSRKVKLEYVQYSVLTPLPGTVVYEQFEQENRLLHKNWNFYDGLHVVHSPKNMSALELQRGIVDCFRSFYSYSNAFREGTRTVLRTVQSAGKHISDMKWHALYPTLIKLAGKHIVNEWTRLNQSYLNYLNEITPNCFQFPAPVDGK